jgi:hypothetical protein
VVTTKAAVLLVAPEVAVIVALPETNALANPVLLTPITLGFDEAHVLAAVRFCVLPSV